MLQRLIVLCMSVLCVHLPGVPAPMSVLYPYGPSAGDLTGVKADDDYTSVILDTPVTLWGQVYNTLELSTNGIVSTRYYPDDYAGLPFPYANFMSASILAPFWIDIALISNTDGQMYYRQVTSGPELTQATDDVIGGLHTSSNLDIAGDFIADYLLVVTYYEATFFNGDDTTPANTFQMVLVADSVTSRTFIMYNYGDIQWQSFIGSFALTGYDVADGVHYYSIPGSGTSQLTFTETCTNVNTAGRWLMQVDITCNPDLCSHGSCLEDGKCLCTENFEGDTCEVDLRGICEPNPCGVGGICNPSECIDEFACECLTGYTGPFCETNIDDCGVHECDNGVCVDGVAGYTCSCDTGFRGRLCDQEADECLPCPCLYGSCSEYPGGYLCDCDPGFEGYDCDENIDDCLDVPCGEHGVCIDGFDNYTCECHPGYSGANCEVDDDECLSGPCLNGMCMDGSNQFACNCDPGYTGERCEININDCANSPCVHGTCRDGINTFTCDCRSGYTGRQCEDNIDDCASKPCVNGVCLDKVAGYKCSCYHGFIGYNCDSQINECASSPCVHGTCVDDINRYDCSCKEGYTGTHCETDINECDPGYCIHGACTDDINSFNCECPLGYTGPLCEVNINDCSPDPCRNATCLDGVGDYQCVCVEGLTGKDCEVDIRPPIGSWSAWSDWSDCTKDCDTGLRQRSKQCLRNPCTDSNIEKDICNIQQCEEDPMEPIDLAVNLETCKCGLEYVIAEEQLLATIADLLNDFCISTLLRCCQIINLEPRPSEIPFGIFQKSDIKVVSSYPRRIDSKNILKILAGVNRNDLNGACGASHDPSLTSLIYMPKDIVEDAIRFDTNLNSKWSCCMTLVTEEEEDPINKFWVVLASTIVPIVIVIIALLLYLILPQGNGTWLRSRGRNSQNDMTSSNDDLVSARWWGFRYQPRYISNKNLYQ